MFYNKTDISITLLYETKIHPGEKKTCMHNLLSSCQTTRYKNIKLVIWDINTIHSFSSIIM